MTKNVLVNILIVLLSLPVSFIQTRLIYLLTDATEVWKMSPINLQYVILFGPLIINLLLSILIITLKNIPAKRLYFTYITLSTTLTLIASGFIDQDILQNDFLIPLWIAIFFNYFLLLLIWKKYLNRKILFISFLTILVILIFYTILNLYFSYRLPLPGRVALTVDSDGRRRSIDVVIRSQNKEIIINLPSDLPTTFYLAEGEYIVITAWADPGGFIRCMGHVKEPIIVILDKTGGPKYVTTEMGELC